MIKFTEDDFKDSGPITFSDKDFETKTSSKDFLSQGKQRASQRIEQRGNPLSDFLKSFSQQKQETPEQALRASVLKTMLGATGLPQQLSYLGTTSPTEAFDLGKRTIKGAETAGRALESPIAGLGQAASQLGEAASLGMFGKGQEAKDVLSQIPGDLAGAMTIQKPVEFGDVYLQTGTPEAQANTLGLITSVAFDPTSIKPETLKFAGSKIRDVAKEGMDNVHKGLENVKKIYNYQTQVEKGLDYTTKAKKVSERLARMYDAKGYKLDKVVTEKALMLEDNIANITSKLNDASFQTSVEIQEQLPTLFKKASENYGKALQELSTSGKQNVQMFKGEITDALNKTLNEHDLISEAPDFLEQLQKFASKRGISFDEKLGKFSFKTERGYKLKNLITEFIEIKSQISKGSWYKNTDRPVLTFAREFGDKIGELSPEFKALQGSYKKVIQVRKDLSKLFKPRDAETALKSAENFLKRVTSGNQKVLSGSEEQLLKYLEEGVEDLMPGTGNISASVRQVNEELKQANFVKRMLGQESKEAKRAIAMARKSARQALKDKVAKYIAENEAYKHSMPYKVGKKVSKLSGGILGYEIMRRTLRKLIHSN